MFKTIIMAVAFFLEALLLLYIPIRKSVLKKSLGNYLMAFKSKNLVRNIWIIVFALALISLIPFFDYKIYVDIALAGCALVGTYIAVRDLSTYGLEGFWEKGFCYSGLYLPYYKIQSVQDVDNVNVEGIVYVTLSNSKTQSITFLKEGEKKLFLDKMKELKLIK